MYTHDDYWLLGYGYKDTTVEYDKVLITKGRRDRKVLSEVAIHTNSKFEDVGDKSILKVEGKAKDLLAKDKMPIIPDAYSWSFICGFFDAYGEFRADSRSPRVFVKSSEENVISLITRKWEVKSPHVDKVQAFGYKALDICGRMYANVRMKNNFNYGNYLTCLNWGHPSNWSRREHFSYHKLDPKAIPPSKTRVTDSGYDVHAISLERFKGDIYKADTKLAIRPVPGYYFDLIGRSSLPPKGWSLLQGVGVIDQSFRGQLTMHMQKLWPDATIPEMPWKCGQLIPRPIVHLDWDEMMELDETDRGQKGFGSSD